VPGGLVADVLGAVTGFESKTVIDATNLAGPRRRTAVPLALSASSRGPQAWRADVSEPVDRAGRSLDGGCRALARTSRRPAGAASGRLRRLRR
jgi:hypothetical protein